MEFRILRLSSQLTFRLCLEVCWCVVEFGATVLSFDCHLSPWLFSVSFSFLLEHLNCFLGSHFLSVGFFFFLLAFFNKCIIFILSSLSGLLYASSHPRLALYVKCVSIYHFLPLILGSIFLGLGTTDACCGSCPVHCSIPVLYPLDVIAPPRLIGNVSRHYQMSLQVGSKRTPG